MGEKTLLVELEKDREKIVEKKLAQTRERAERKREKENPKPEKKKYFNAFSSKTFKGEEIVQKAQEKISPTQIASPQITEEEEVAKVESKVSDVIEKPNYDYVETLTETQREKIFKIERAEKSKTQTKPKRLKLVIISVLFALFGVWGVVNIAQIDNLGSQIAEVAKDYYEINLPKYLKKLTSLDATNSGNMENLFETIPDEDISPSEIFEKSNWFDRICNFIAGLFGG